jgi:outer membrane protein
LHEDIVKNIAAAVVVGMALLAAPLVYGQGQKIGYVNSAKIFQELPAAQEAQKRIDAFAKPYQDSLETMQRELQGRYEDYQKKEALMNDQTKRAEQQKLIEMERQFNAFRVEKFGNEGVIAKESEKLLTPLREKIKTAIAGVAKDEKYTFVFDKTEQVQILVYGDPAHDLTFKVIDKLKRGK